TINVFGMATLVAAFGFAATLDVLNPDAFVARQMIARNDVDPVYLVSLSDEAIPAMAALVDAPQPGLRQMVRNELLEREGYGPVPTQIGDWRDFSLGHNAAYASLLPIMDKLKDSRALSYTLDDFSSLKQGMSYREIVRQFGNPYN